MNKFLQIMVLLTLSVLSAGAQTPAPTPQDTQDVESVGKYDNSDPLYLKLRDNDSLGECATVNNLVLKRDRGFFTLRSGDLCFFSPIEGKVTGAVFVGDGEFSLIPPSEIEKKMVKIFTDSTEVKEPFTEVIFYFSDKTYDEVKGSPNAQLKQASNQNALKVWKDKKEEFKQNGIDQASRNLADLLAPDRKGFFDAIIKGKNHKKLEYIVDPLGVPVVYPEQVVLLSGDADTAGIWTAFHMEEEYKKGTANSLADRRIYDMIHHNMDVTIQGTKITASDTVTMNMREANSRLLPFLLFSGLRLKRITDENGNDLFFIQGKKFKGSEFWVILPKAMEVGKPFKVTFEYSGDKALSGEGTGNFYLGPRSTWYPQNPLADFGDRAAFDIFFRYPKKYTLVGIGNRVGEEGITSKDKKKEKDNKSDSGKAAENAEKQGGPAEDNSLAVSRWSTDGIEYEVAGFNYGDFKVERAKDSQSGYEVEVYANRQVPDEIKRLQDAIAQRESDRAAGNVVSRQPVDGVDNSIVGGMNTTGGMPLVMSQARNASAIYNDFFGKLPYKRMAMTQQPAGFFGQAWPTLVFLPYFAYVGGSQRADLFGAQGETDGFWQEVTAHEVAHQWWGHIVGWNSYHDQWMSEGFSEFSASLYVHYVKKDPEALINYWETLRKQIVEPTPATKGKKPYTVGPVTQGYRLNSAKTGGVARYLIYPKGGYILHMIRMMMYDFRTGTRDDRFKAMMRDFVKTHYNKLVSTEDFKRIVEKHMTPEMDIDGNKKMDWFFDQYVYGTDVPNYNFTYQLGSSGGKTTLNAKITQSGVSDKFVMLVPVYADYGKGWSYLGSATIVGNSSVDLTNIPLSQTPKKVTINALKDVLYDKQEISKQ